MLGRGGERDGPAEVWVEVEIGLETLDVLRGEGSK